MDKVQLAVENFAKKKYNCTQAVVCAFCEDFAAAWARWAASAAR